MKEKISTPEEIEAIQVSRMNCLLEDKDYEIFLGSNVIRHKSGVVLCFIPDGEIKVHADFLPMGDLELVVETISMVQKKFPIWVGLWKAKNEEGPNKEA